MLSLRYCLLFALVATPLASAQVYKWVDENGVVHYSDQPVAGAEEIRIDQRATPAARSTANEPDARSPDSEPEPVAAAAPFSYESLAVTAPVAEQTLWNIGGELTVTLSLSPGLRSGDRVRLYFDGESRMINGLRTTLEEVWRGEHNLQAEVIDASGRLMIRSEPIRFYVQQTSVLN